MKWSIILVVIGAVSLILGMIARLLVYGGTVLFLGMPAGTYLDFANTMVFFAIAIALIVKFRRS